MVLIVVLLNENYLSSAPKFIQQIEVAFHHFDLLRCDEKTFYITVRFKYRAQDVICDFIYLIDQPEVYGAISINKHYANARNFIQQHFRHILCYSDELILAKNFMNTSSFKQCMQKFAKKYPKFIVNKIEHRHQMWG